jgi:hypothetical protein
MNARRSIVMPRSQVTVRIRRPSDVVFESLVSHTWRNEPAWEPEVLEVRPQGDGPLALGSRVLMVRRESGKVFETTYEVTAFDPPRRITARHLDGPMGFVIDFSVEPVDPGNADVTVGVDIRLHGPMRLMTPLFAIMGPRRNARISRQMVVAIEAATPVGRDTLSSKTADFANA